MPGPIDEPRHSLIMSYPYEAGLDTQVIEVQLGNYPLHDVYRPGYVFPGLSPFVDAAGSAAGISQEMAGRAKLGWHAGAMQSALSSLPELAEKIRKGHAKPDSLAGALQRIRDVRGSLAAQLTAFDAAITETYEALGIPIPRSIKTTKK